MAQTIACALLGAGKLGSGFYKIMMDRHEHILSQTGIDFQIKKILVKNKHFQRASFINPDLITDQPAEIINDPEIKIVIDTMFGIEPAFSLIRKILRSGKNLVSANRSMVSARMHELADLANEMKILVNIEAAIGGGLPIISILREDLIANRIRAIYGILGGTSNYILSEMTRQKITLQEVLKSTYVRKIGENLSVIDYEGSDSAQKLSILAAATLGIDTNFLEIFSEGIADVTPEDIEHARMFDYTVKLLAIIKNHNEAIELRVHPTFIRNAHPLASVSDEYNAFYFQTDLLGNYMLYGKGVGIEPTSSLLIKDLTVMGERLLSDSKRNDYKLSWDERPLLPIGEIETSYYLLFPCQNRPGVIGKITSFLGEHKINIGSAHAEVENQEHGNIGQVHIFIEKAVEQDVRNAIDALNTMDFISGKIKFFRILED